MMDVLSECFDWIFLQLQISKLRRERNKKFRDLDRYANRSTRQGQRMYDRLYDEIVCNYETQVRRLKERYDYYKRNDTSQK